MAPGEKTALEFAARHIANAQMSGWLRKCFPVV